MTQIIKSGFILLIFVLGISLSPSSWAQGIVETSSLPKDTVNLGYGSQPAWMVTGSVSQVKGEELKKNFTPDAGNTLYGRLLGLGVSQGNGEPGLQSPTLRIRGINTFGTGNDILVLVDGYELPIGQLVPEEIETITVLKDASATAIYGSKGANGVLLVTTKRGHSGPLKVEFSVQHGVNRATDLPKFLGSYDYARLYNEGQVNDGVLPGDVQYSQEAMDAYRTGNSPYLYPDVNWYSEVLRKIAPSSNYNLNFSGGTSAVKYFVMANMVDIGGLYKKTEDLSDFSIDSKYQRFNFRTNVDIQLSNRLTAHLTLGGTIDDKSNPAANNTSSIFNSLSMLPPNSFPVYNPNRTYGGSTLYSNPYGDLLETGMYTSNGRIFQGSFGLTEQLDMITKGLSMSANISFNNTFTSLSNKSRKYASFSLSPGEGSELIYTKIGEPTSLSGNEGQSDQWRSTTLRAYLNYARNFGVNAFDAAVLFNSSDQSFGVGGLPYVDQGVFGRFTFANNQKYIGEVSFGYNATDNFPKKSRWGLFPAVSLGWIASNEDFLSGSSVVNYLKVRGSYGLTGNDQIGGDRWMFRQNYVGQGSYQFGTTNTNFGTIGEGTIASGDVTWEKQTQFNIGMEATVYKNLELSFDIFQQERYDILATPARVVPSFIGVSLPELNVGKTNNKGFEAMVRYNSDQESDLRYFVQMNAWYSINKIIDNSEPFEVEDYLYRTGRPIGQRFLLESVGFFADQADIANSPRQIFAEVQPGDIKYKDQNNDGVIDQSDYYPSGRNGSFTGSLQAGFEYKGFDLEMMFQGIGNRDVYLEGSYFYAFQNNAKISEIAINRWTPSTASTADYPRLSAGNNQNNFLPSTFWLRNGNFIKLRSLELGYTLSGSLTERLGVKQARVFLNGTNLFSLDKMDFTDPETMSGHPPVRTISLGAKINL